MKDLYDTQFIEEMKQEEEVIVPVREYEEKCDMKELIGLAPLAEDVLEPDLRKKKRGDPLKIKLCALLFEDLVRLGNKLVH